MKKLLCVITTLFVLAGAAFTQESKKWYDDISAGALVRLGLFTNALEVHTRYEFQLTQSMHIDAGLNVNTAIPSLLGVLAGGASQFGNEGEISEKGGDVDSVKTSVGGLSIIPNVSFWFKDFYAFYGLGIGNSFIPYDIRLGWQPGETKKEKGVCFNMELGVTATPVVTEYIDENNKEARNEVKYPDFFITLGAMYKL